MQPQGSLRMTWMNHRSAVSVKAHHGDRDVTAVLCAAEKEVTLNEEAVGEK